jgi:hypothetical protein
MRRLPPPKDEKIGVRSLAPKFNIFEFDSYPSTAPLQARLPITRSNHTDLIKIPAE